VLEPQGRQRAHDNRNATKAATQQDGNHEKHQRLLCSCSSRQQNRKSTIRTLVRFAWHCHVMRFNGTEDRINVHMTCLPRACRHVAQKAGSGPMPLYNLFCSLQLACSNAPHAKSGPKHVVRCASCESVRCHASAQYHDTQLVEGTYAVLDYSSDLRLLGKSRH